MILENIWFGPGKFATLAFILEQNEGQTVHLFLHLTLGQTSCLFKVYKI